MEIKDLYGKLCKKGIIKEEYKILERKGLTRTLDFPNVLKIEWIKIVLRRIYEKICMVIKWTYQDY